MTTARFDISVPDFALQAMRALEDAGHEAWLVGGCVRDALLGREVHDYDIATSATWSETEQALVAKNIPVHRTGTAHGTVTASIDHNPLEITTYRADGTYSDGRHPDSVSFVRNIEDDLARRDFTINALAYHPERGVLDLWDGVADLQNHVLRAVGDPPQRFREDSLRILRGCRFVSQLGFSIEPATLQAMKSCKMGLQRVSVERTVHELDGLLLGDHVHDALMLTIDVLVAVMPEIAACKGFDQHTPYHIYDVWEHTAWVVQHTPPARLVRWAALLHDIGKPGAFFMDGERGHFYGHPKLSVILARDILKRFKISPAFSARVLKLVECHDATIPATTKAVRKRLAQLDGDVELFEALCDLKRADALSQSELSKPRLQLAIELKEILHELLAQQAPFTVKQLAVNGNDIIELGVNAGPDVGTVLQQLLEAVIDERFANDRDQLLALAGTLAKDLKPM